MNTHYRLPDTRAYPTDPVKNQLLQYATHIALSSSKAQITLAQENLSVEITQMLAQNHYTSLSVALAMAPDAQVYKALWQNLVTVLQAHNEQEIQWLALPVVVVGGAKQDLLLSNTIPDKAISTVFHQQPWLKAWQNIHWAKQLITADTLADIKANSWFAAKKNQNAAQALLDQLPETNLILKSGQSVQVFYALGYADQTIQPALNFSLGDTALPLMQVWQEALSVPAATLFTNPLPPLPPLQAMHEGNAMRLRMACDVFTTNAIRSIRLQSPRVGVVIAANQNGQILFGFNATDSAFELQQQIFSWSLTPADNIDVIIQNFIDLLVECGVENIRLLHEPIAMTELLPSYASALNISGHNPLFKTSH